jgi:predicted amidohydrolase YtcJ
LTSPAKADRLAISGQIAHLGFQLSQASGRESNKVAGNLQSASPVLRRRADLVLLNGKIWTGEPMAVGVPHPPPAGWAQAVATTNGRIAAVGTNQEIRSYASAGAEVVDLGGKLVLPGFIDSHVHFLEAGFQLGDVNLRDAASEGEFLARIASQAGALSSGRWMLGGNWDESSWPGQNLPTRWMIDPVTPHHPVFLRRFDGHAALVNSLAVKMAGIGRDTSDPPGGALVRDPATGQPTGVLKDYAQDLVRRIIPPPSEAEALEALRAGLAEARRLGVTSVHDMNLGGRSPGGGFLGGLDALRRARNEGWLTCRFYEIIPIQDWKRLRDMGAFHRTADGWITLGAVKAFADGSLGSRTAWMDEAYADDASNSGLPMPLMDPPAKLRTLARDAAGSGFQLALHAIGTRAVAEVLDIIQEIGGDNVGARRFRVEHAQHVRPEDFARFGRLGVIASMQPYHAVDDARWVEARIGPERARWSYAWRSMLDGGAPIAFGTDWPVAPLNPLLGIYASVTRAIRSPSGAAVRRRGWIPEETISLEEALRAYTQGGAYAAFQENQKGTIAPGKLADIVVLSDDLFSIPFEKIESIRVEMTILHGKIIYDAR